MKIFISWSGITSSALADKLKDWVDFVFGNEVTLWMSASSIDKGKKWKEKLDKELNDTNFAILCLTPDNINAPWLLFEAGALSKSSDTESSVVPYCLGFHPSEISGPLSEFQGVQADKEGTFDLLMSINKLLKNKKDTGELKKKFDALWPDLNTFLSSLQVHNPAKPAIVKVNRVLCGVTADFANRGGDKDIQILKDNFGDRVTVIENMSLNSLRGALTKHKFEIVHLVGLVEHKNGDFIFAEDETINAEGMLTLLKQSETKFAVLATCDSVMLAAVLSRHMSVISGVGNIQINEIVKWEECFYSLLCDGKSMKDAYEITMATAKTTMVVFTSHDFFVS